MVGDSALPLPILVVADNAREFFMPANVHPPLQSPPAPPTSLEPEEEEEEEEEHHGEESGGGSVEARALLSDRYTPTLGSFFQFYSLTPVGYQNGPPD